MAAIVIPTIVVIFLLILPFLDTGPRRHPLERRFWAGVGVAGLAGLVGLTIAGYRSPRINPSVSENPLVLEGRRLFQEGGCTHCHSVSGRGGVVGPDLSSVGTPRDELWLSEHFKDPQKVTPGSVMPKFNLMEDEIAALVAYMKTLGGGGPFSPRAPRLFEENCLSCHVLDGKGGDAGPDLTAIRGYRDKAAIYSYTESPQSLNPDATMPGFKGTLTDDEIEDLTRYLLSPQRRK